MKKTIIFVSLFVIISGLFSCQFGKNLSTPSPAERDTTENVEETKFAEKTIEDATETWSDEASVDIETHVETIVTEPEDSPEWMEISAPAPSYEPTVQVLKYGGGFLNISNVSLNYEDEIDLKTYTDKKFMPESMSATIKVNGETLTGTYDYREKSPYYQSNCLVYNIPGESGNCVTFVLAEDTGRMIRYTDFEFEQKIQDGIISGPALSKEECLSLAEKFLREVVGVSGEYVLRSEKYTKANSRLYGRYRFVFERYIDQMRTDEYASVNIGEMGVVRSFSVNMLGSMDGVSIPEYNEEEIVQAIEHKLATIYAPVREKTNGYYSIEDTCLTRLEDGELYLKYIVSIQCPVEETTFCYDKTCLLVRIS